MPVQDDDKFIVNRGGTDYKVSASSIDDKLQDADEVLINRGGTDYKVSGADLRQYLGIEKMPWKDADVIYHVILTDPNAINIHNHDAIYNKDTLAKVDSIDAAGEYIITGDNDTYFMESPGNWEFGNLTDTSKVTDMWQMFYNCPTFNSDLTYFDTSNVRDMTEMFHEASSFNGDISGWDTSNVRNMENMFSNARSFNSDISRWNTSNVGDMSRMFYDAKAFNQDISNWNTSNVTEMLGMFWGASSFNLDLSEWCVIKFEGDPNMGPPMWCEGTGFQDDKDKHPKWGTCPRGEDTP